ncbi:MAG: type II toxin-antitoxin system VapC family toxin [Methanosarcinales archaeon]
MMYVLDASVVIKWFSEEEHTDKALEIRDKFLRGKCDIAVPDLLLYEVSNALRYNPDFEEEDVNDAINSLFDMEIDIIVPISKIIKSAINLAFKYDITIYDATYVALAKEIRFTFITADNKLYRKIKELNLVKLISEI